MFKLFKLFTIIMLSLLITTCDSDPDNDCIEDCNDECGGSAYLDDCGDCVGGNTNRDENHDMDCNGECGGTAEEDNCGVCDSDLDNDCDADCNGDWGGDALEDNCGVCDSDPDNDCAADCNGDWGGDALEDNCGVCDSNPDNDCYGTSPGFENAAGDYTTDANNEVIATVNAGSTRSVDVDAFIEAVANELSCDFDDIQVTGSTTDGDLVYISFIFISNADNLLEDIQSALSDGNVGGFQAMIVIANMDDDIACNLGLDCDDICGGSALIDACGECGGDSSGCDDGDYVGLYQLYSLKQYDDYDDNDYTCSGSVEYSWSGPTFNISEEYNYDTDCSDCSCSYGEFSAEIRIYVELKANGEYRFFRFENDSVDEHVDCYGECGGDYDEECYCEMYADDEDEFTLETGTWSVDDGMLSVNPCTFKEWESGFENRSYSCDDYSYSNEMNGCLSEDWDGCNDSYNYDYYDAWDDVFEETSEGFYIHAPDDDGECERMEFIRIYSFPDVSGCTDPFANNYNAAATIDDGTCGNGSCYDDYYYNNKENSNKIKKSIFSLSK